MERCLLKRENLVRVWVIHSVGWSLPVLARKFDGMIKVEVPPVPLTRGMRRTLDGWLQEHCAQNEGEWWILAERFDALADLQPFNTDPDDCIYWTPEVGRRVAVKEPDEMEEFFRHLATAGYKFMDTPGKAQLAWGAFSRLALDWMVNHGGRLDLGFAVLQPLPFRPDWTRMLVDKFVGALHGHKRLGRGRKEARQRAMAKFPEWLKQTKLMSMSRKDNNRVNWTLHVKHRSEWYRTMIGLEKARRRGQTGLKYYARLEQQVAGRAAMAREIFLDYLTQTHRPYPVVYTGNTCGGKRKGTIRARLHKLTNARRTIYDERTESIVQGFHVAHGNMPAVPNIRPGTKDVRDGR